MEQNYRVFSYCRIPGRGQDVLRSLEPQGPLHNRHVILACRNKLYALHLRGEDPSDQGLSEEEVAGHILHVLENGAEDPLPISVLTSQRRDNWADHREQLLQYDENRESLRYVEEGLIMLCLDLKPLGSEFNRRTNRGGQGMTVGGRDETNMEHHMIHGGGSRYNSLNRWFDKPLEFVISIDGVNGLCVEHSPAEGVAVVQIVDEMLDACKDLVPSNAAMSQLDTSALRELQWIKPTGFHRVIADAIKSLDNQVEDLDLFIYRFEGYGKNFIKSCKVSPDAYIQLALQLAYYKLYGRLTATYESASTRRFMLGRVDCIRSGTWEALQWVSAMTQGDEAGDPLHPAKRVTFSFITEKEKLELFDTAIKKQTEIMIDNILGQGIDIHLMGLREQSKLMDMPMDLFEDETFKTANHFALSTSQVAMKAGFGGYGPVVADGYGACYNILNDSVIFSISAFYSSELTSSPRFVQSLEESLSAVQQLLQSRATQTK